MSRKMMGLCTAIVIAVVVIGVGVVPSYSRTLEKNWYVSLPWQAKMREVYEKDSGASFHGDEVRYHVFSYKYKDYIDLMCAWSGNKPDVVGELYAVPWLDEIEVPDEERPNYEQCFYMHRLKNGNDIISFWDTEKNLVYVIENLL